MIPNFKYYQPIILGDLVEYDGYFYNIISIIRKTDYYYSIELLLSDRQNRYRKIEIDTNPNIRYLITLKVSCTDYQIANNNIKGEIRLVERLFNNLSDVFCRYEICPLKKFRKNIETDICKYCNCYNNLSASDFFLIEDEVMSFTEKDKMIGTIKGMFLFYTKQLYLKHSISCNEERKKVLKEFYDIFNEGRLNLDLITYLILSKGVAKNFLLSCDGSLDFYKPMISISSKESLRLRNRHGFTYDFNKDLCKNCIYSNCNDCDFLNFKKNVINNDLKLNLL